MNINDFLESNTCPVCHRHCPLSEPSCGGGARYAEAVRQGEPPEEAAQRIREKKRERERERGRDRERGREREGGRGPRGGREDGGCWWGAEREEELFGMLGKCGHYLYSRPGRGRGQRRVLKMLDQRGTMSQREMQELLDIQPGSLSELLLKLESRGLIVREKAEEDKRRAVVSLTGAGRAALEEEDGPRDAELFAVLSEEEQAQLRALLTKLLQQWYPKD